MGDGGFVPPVDPDELGQWEESLPGLVYFLPVSKAGASAEAVVGIGANFLGEDNPAPASRRGHEILTARVVQAEYIG